MGVLATFLLSGDNVVLAAEDADTSHLTEGGRVLGVPLCRIHADAYHTLRGHQVCVCVIKDCQRLGSMGPDGAFYCGSHIASALTPAPPKPG